MTDAGRRGMKTAVNRVNICLFHTCSLRGNTNHTQPGCSPALQPDASLQQDSQVWTGLKTTNSHNPCPIWRLKPQRAASHAASVRSNTWRLQNRWRGTFPSELWPSRGNLEPLQFWLSRFLNSNRVMWGVKYQYRLILSFIFQANKGLKTGSLWVLDFHWDKTRHLKTSLWVLWSEAQQVSPYEHFITVHSYIVTISSNT